MSKPNISEQIRDVDYAIAAYPEYQYSLIRHRSMLNILTVVDKLPLKGSTLNWEESVHIFSQVIKGGKTIISVLNASMFDSQIVMETWQKITSVLLNQETDGKNVYNIKKVHRALKKGEGNVYQSLSAVFTGDSDWFKTQEKKFIVKAGILMFIFSAPIQPYLEEVARRMNEKILNQWWQPFCPVCGRRPITAWFSEGKRYPTCTFCGSQYLTDRFLCINCGNTDPYSLGFMTLKDHAEFHIDFCSKCNHYIKVIHENKLEKKIPRGLEDYLTQRLDELAVESGFTRI